MEFKLTQAAGRFVVVEPYEKSSVLKAEEISTVFKIVSLGKEAKILILGAGYIEKEDYKEGDLVIVSPNTVEKTMMGQKEINYVRDTDIVARVSEVA